MQIINFLKNIFRRKRVYKYTEMGYYITKKNDGTFTMEEFKRETL